MNAGHAAFVIGTAFIERIEDIFSLGNDSEIGSAVVELVTVNVVDDSPSVRTGQLVAHDLAMDEDDTTATGAVDVALLGDAPAVLAEELGVGVVYEDEID